MQEKYNEKVKNAIWVAHQLFSRKLVTGSTGNISFLYHDKMYISKSGSCFGRLDENSFATLSLQGEIVDGNPSKEYPLHLALYNSNDGYKVIIHTHSLYSTSISCINDIESTINNLFSYTPYLKMLTNGRVGIIPYHKPGSIELFDDFKNNVKKDTSFYIMRNHGVIVGDSTMYKAFDVIEEFESSANIQVIINNYNPCDFKKIE